MNPSDLSASLRAHLPFHNFRFFGRITRMTKLVSLSMPRQPHRKNKYSLCCLSSLLVLATFVVNFDKQDIKMVNVNVLISNHTLLHHIKRNFPSVVKKSTISVFHSVSKHCRNQTKLSKIYNKNGPGKTFRASL